MKKILLSLVLVSSIGFYVSAQHNLLENGDFEEQGAWKVCQGNLADTIWYEFGSTENTVNGGEGANLAIKLIPGATGIQQNLTVYQALDLVGEQEYLVSCAIRDMSVDHGDCWWLKYCWIALEPVPDADVDEQGIFNMHEWMDHASVYGFNGLLDTFQLGIADESGTNIFVPEADGIYYVGINFGACNDTGDFHYIVDEIALIDQDAPSGINTQLSDNRITLYLYPNPATTNIDFTYSISENSEVELSLINILGHEVAILTNETRIKGTYKESFDCSNLADGVYYGILKANNKIITKKFIVLK